MLINLDYEILNSSGEFVEFLGVEKSPKNRGLKITLENNKFIIVSNDHIFITNGVNVFANSLVPNVSYLTTDEGDFYVKSIEKIENIDLYDIVDSVGCEYYANGFLNHNCSFLGSGDNFIAEEFLLRIEEKEIKPPIRQEYTDLNMWIFEDAIEGEEYVFGVDVAPGHGDDNSTINILKVTTYIEDKIVLKNNKHKRIKVRRNKVEQVGEYYGKLTPQDLGDLIFQYAPIYNNAYVVVDITGGHGAQTVEKLLELGYDNNFVYYSEVKHKPSRDRLYGYIRRGEKIAPDGSVFQIDLIPGFFIGNNRPSVLLELQRAIHMGDVIIRSARLSNELKTFVTVSGNRVADHKRTFHDDSIMGISIALYVIAYDMNKTNVTKETSMRLLDAMISINDQSQTTDPKRKRRLDLDERKERILSSKNARQFNQHLANSWLFDGLSNKRRF